MAGKAIMDLDIPMDILIVMIKRKDKLITPRGTTVIKPADTLMLAGDYELLLEINKEIEKLTS